MLVHPESFPSNRRADPKRQGELHVYTEVADSPAVGLAIYGGKAGPEAPEADFVMWLQKEARANVEVKGGRYTFELGQWTLHSVNGPEPIDSPVIQAKDGAFSFRDAVKKALSRKVFVLAVIVFPDMDPDQAIVQEATRHKVHVLFGASGLVKKILEIAGKEEIFMPPTPSHIRDEAHLFVPGIQYPPQGVAEPRADGDAAECPSTNIAARQVIIQHAGVVNVYTTEGSEGRPGPGGGVGHRSWPPS